MPRLSKVPINVADRLMAGERPDPVLILCKAAGLGWPTVRAVIVARPDGKAHVEPRLRCRLRQLRTALGIDRAARGALLAGRGKTSKIQRWTSATNFKFSGKIRKHDARCSRAALA